jgi:c-di-GMP-binding flagellar brake protein YcgR
VKPKKKRETVAKKKDRNNKRVNIALPIRITYWDEDNKPGLEMACTYDISSTGARISKLRSVNQPGEIVAVERGRNKAYCRVVWIGDEKSKLHGQIGLECVEPDRNLWETELHDMEDVYEKVEKNQLPAKSALAGNRRRRERVEVDGKAEIVKSDSIALNESLVAELKDLSEIGCLVKTKESLPRGTDVKLVLKVGKHDLALKGKVKNTQAGGVGIEFAQIRKSDRQTLKFLVEKLKEQNFEDILEVEV